MKIDPRAAAAFLKKPDPAVRAVLFYGPDLGLVRERGEGLTRLIVDDLNDPFRVAEFSGDALADDPARLADEAAAQALTGGRRVVRVRPCGNEAAAAFAAFLKHPSGDTLVVIEAGELDGRSALRKLFDGADNAAAVACYRDEGRDLAAVVRDTLAAHKVQANPEALAWLAGRLGGDRMVTRGELEKLALYVGPGATASLDDARAVVGDSAEIDFDDVTAAVAGGDVGGLERALDRLAAEGASPVAILRAVQRHFMRLHLCAGLVAEGKNEKGAMMSLRPPVFWKEEAAFRAALRRWPLARLGAALSRLLDAEIQCKSSGQPAELMAGRCLLALAHSA
ncbi:MAG: DNA polymerase III subunit delta [Rhodospirillales bacterium]|nr:DNA polymerase III subunit delta [Rhodospirillales bacterium]